MAFCIKCGKQMRDDSRFCPFCGQKAEVAAPPPQMQQQYQQPLQYQQTPQPQQYQQTQPQNQQSAQYQQPGPQQYQQPTQYQQPGPQPQYQQPQYSAQQGSSMPADKQTVLYQAPAALNMPNRPWVATVEGDSIVARWKWMDATFFAPHEVNNEVKQFSFTVTLTDKGTWKEIDRTENKSSGVKMSGGKLSFGSSSNSFKGKTNQKSFQFGVGQNNQTGETGIIGFKFDTTAVKQPIRDYLTACGWKKAGMF